MWQENLGESFHLCYGRLAKVLKAFLPSCSTTLSWSHTSKAGRFLKIPTKDIWLLIKDVNYWIYQNVYWLSGFFFTWFNFLDLLFKYLNVAVIDFMNQETFKCLYRYNKCQGVNSVDTKFSLAWGGEWDRDSRRKAKERERNKRLRRKYRAQRVSHK